MTNFTAGISGVWLNTRFEPKMSQNSGVPINKVQTANTKDEGMTAKRDKPAQPRIRKR